MADEVIHKSEAEWRAQLTPEQYRVTREKGTERPFSGEYCRTMTPGTYVCVCCEQPLYSSHTKFHSGCGWPAFSAGISEEAIVTEQDTSFGMVRTEILCSRCGAHLGHSFPDGPPPTGIRHCVNSVSIKLLPEER